MRAMPSPISSTRPTSRSTIWERYWSISLVNTEAISSALNLIATSLDELFPKGLELSSAGGVIDPTPDPDDPAAGQIGLDASFQDRFPPEGFPQSVLEPIPLIVRQGDGRAHLDAHPAGSLVAQIPVGGQDGPNQN